MAIKSNDTEKPFFFVQKIKNMLIFYDIFQHVL